MAMMSARRSGGWMFSVKLVFISTAVLSTAVVLKLSAPSIRGFVISDLPRIYSSLLSWLTPPYLYFVINGIIISIAACSQFQKAADGAEPVGSVAYHSQAKAPLEIAQEYVHVPQVAFEVLVLKAAEAETLTEIEPKLGEWSTETRVRWNFGHISASTFSDPTVKIPSSLLERGMERVEVREWNGERSTTTAWEIRSSKQVKEWVREWRSEGEVTEVR